MRILIDTAVDDQLSRALQDCLDRCGISAAIGSRPDHDSHGPIDAFVTTPARLRAVSEVLMSRQRTLPLVVVSQVDESEDGRAMLELGAQAIVEPALGPTVVAAAIAAAAGGSVVVPKRVADALTQRLEQVPSMSDSDRAFVAALSEGNVAEAAEMVGYSVRTGQRRYQALLKRLRLRNHWELAAAAGRWGLSKPLRRGNEAPMEN
jgi:DNA-binding NarL/FixJ family response regulator